MALTTCRECGASVARNAPICLKCGHVFKRRRRWTLGKIFLLVLVFSLAFHWFSPQDESPRRTDATSSAGTANATPADVDDQARAQLARQFESDREGIIARATGALDRNEFRQVITNYSRYLVLDDPELAAIVATAKAGLDGQKAALAEEQAERQSQRAAAPSGTTASTVPRQWYEGGTLHKSTIGDWRSASQRDQLATAADFVAAVGAAANHEDLLVRAHGLRTCIDEVAGDANNRAMQVAEIGAMCAVILGYK